MTIIPCAQNHFLGLPTWDEDLNCNGGSPSLTGINDVWLIAAAIVDILLRLAAIIAIFMLIYGGIQFITSQGDPEKASHARGTIINALIGLVISVVAATLVTYIAGRFSAS